LATDISLLLIEDLLQILGAFVVFSVALVSYYGYKKVESPTMLRLTIAFLLLGGGFMLSGIIGLTNLDLQSPIPLWVSAVVIGASSLEAAGYFFLAFSYMMNVRGFGKASTVPVFALVAAVPVVALKAIAIYFLLYGIIETLISYLKVKKIETLTIAFGLVLIASAEFIRWISFLYPTETTILAASLIIRVFGFITLFVPVLRFVSLRGKYI